MNQNHLVLSVLGSDQSGILSDLSQTVMECGCSVEDSRMTVLGDEFAMVMLISGKWNAIAKLETALGSLSQKRDLNIQHKRTEARKVSTDTLPYGVDVAALDQPGLVHQIANFFSSRKINVEELVTNRYAAPHTGSPMFAIRMNIAVPADVQLATLREEFLEACDRMNVDAVLEPIKG